MKLSRYQSDRQPRVSAHTVLESHTAESPTADLEALLSSPLFQAMREKLRTEVTVRAEDITSLAWVPAVDPSFRHNSLEKPGLKEDAMQWLGEKEAGLAEMERLKSDPGAGISVGGLEAQVCQTGSILIQLFPEQRTQPPFKLFTLDRLDRVLKHALKGLSDNSIFSAYRLISVWPAEREKIIQTLFPGKALSPEEITHYFSKPISLKPPLPGSPIRRRHSQSESLECFLLVFPEYRPLLADQINQRIQKLRAEIATIDPAPTPDPGEFKLARVLSLQRELIVLGCKDAKLNASGLLELPFPTALGKPKSLPVRSAF